MASTQHWDPGRYQRNAGFVAELGLHVLELLDPRPGEDFLASVPAHRRPAPRAEVQEAVRHQLQEHAGQWNADYVRSRFAARLPA